MPRMVPSRTCTFYYMLRGFFFFFSCFSFQTLLFLVPWIFFYLVFVMSSSFKDRFTMPHDDVSHGRATTIRGQIYIYIYGMLEKAHQDTCTLFSFEYLRVPHV